MTAVGANLAMPAASLGLAGHRVARRIKVPALRLLPLVVGLGFIQLTFLLFLFGPFNWPIFNYAPVEGYFLAVNGAIAAGFLLHLRGRPKRARPLRTKTFIAIGSIAAVVLLVPSSIVYAGRWPWQVMEALADQNEAYRSFADQLGDSPLTRLPIILARTLASPFIFSVLPLGILNRHKLNPLLWSGLVATVLCDAIFSILRGTTRELGDIAIVSLSAMMILAVRKIEASPRPLRQATRYATQTLVVVAALLAVVLASVTIRAEARLGSQARYCITDTGICDDNLSPLEAFIPDGAKFLFDNTAGYLSQGYYGLSLGLGQDFQSSLGVGHSPAVASAASALFGVKGLYENSYTYRNYFNGWNDETQWSTMAIWIANDVGFPGALIFFALMGYLWSMAWKDAVYARNDRAAVFCCVIMMAVFYFPANNQMMATFDSYLTTIFWLIYWISGRRL